MSDAIWLDLMRADLGMAEMPGGQSNADILARFDHCGHPEIEHDEVAWCAAQVGSCLHRAGYPLPPRNVNLMARSYLTYGVACEPKPGAIAVWARGAPPFGHVNVVESVLPNGRVICIDGNSNNRVARTNRSASDALAYRWPVKPTVEALRKAGSSEIAVATVLRNIAVGTTGTALTATAATEATEATKAAQSAPPVLDVSALPDLDPATEYLGGTRALMEGIHAIFDLLAANPWLAPAAVLAIGAWLLARRIEAKRVEKARSGVPISAEVEA